MIAQYLFQVDMPEEIPASRAYAFYSCLLSLLPEETAVWLHEQGETPVSQFLYQDRQTKLTYWQVGLLGKAAVQIFAPILDNLTVLKTNIDDVPLILCSCQKLTAPELIEKARSLPESKRITLRLLSPMAFKQSGHYAILPETKLIVQSLMNKWNSSFPDYPLDDADAAQMLMSGLRISDLSIRSTRYSLKANRIPGIIGSITIDASLSVPMMEIWKMLICFSSFSGIGIKTALGMGGAAIKSTD